eukprot:CAMPEP_0172164306 /NCGR_PEP_ID=MMETSP1050-20130122/7773_1 /TAXON_ID=233186 /ORGANISM="Cryptomonas curvata, Strain CCAP979/52" /LENGTH=46 /DNA_ID= /DNA_START= /DNA_END= /DNA_ORIENTATION=
MVDARHTKVKMKLSVAVPSFHDSRKARMPLHIGMVIHSEVIPRMCL